MKGESCEFTIDTPIRNPVTNVPVISTHPAMASTTVNSRKSSFSEMISPGYADGLNAFNNTCNKLTTCSSSRRWCTLQNITDVFVFSSFTHNAKNA